MIWKSVNGMFMLQSRRISLGKMFLSSYNLLVGSLRNDNELTKTQSSIVLIRAYIFLQILDLKIDDFT